MVGKFEFLVVGISYLFNMVVGGLISLKFYSCLYLVYCMMVFLLFLVGSDFCCVKVIKGLIGICLIDEGIICLIDDF